MFPALDFAAPCFAPLDFAELCFAAVEAFFAGFFSPAVPSEEAHVSSVAMRSPPSTIRQHRDAILLPMK